MLKQHQVGMDGIAVVVNPSLQVRGLTVNQLRQIYLGQLNNWKQVGGPDLTITPFAQPESDTDTVIFSANSKSNKQGLASGVRYVSSTTDALRQVNKTPGGVYYASARAVVPQCSVKPLPLGGRLLQNSFHHTANQECYPNSVRANATKSTPKHSRMVAIL